MAFRRTQTKCEGDFHMWMWPHEVDQNGSPPPDWLCVCGRMFANGQEAKIEKPPMPKNMSGHCPRCYGWIDDHPTSHCDWNWT